MEALRAGLKLWAFLLLSLSLMPVQAVFIRAFPAAARRLPWWYHQKVCQLLGVRLKLHGSVPPDRSALIVSNHTSWLDIPVLSAVSPVSFVAKSEVAGWPFVGTLARLQRTVFVDRTRRTAVTPAANELAGRLGQGDAVVLFAEGTSSDGNRVLPFMSSLFASVASDRPPAQGIVILPLALAYTAYNGVRLGREQRAGVGWFGDMEMRRHAWQLLKASAIEVEIRIGAPIEVAQIADRKQLASVAETEVRRLLVTTLRDLDPAAAPTLSVSAMPRVSRRPGGRGTDVNASFR